MFIFFFFYLTMLFCKWWVLFTDMEFDFYCLILELFVLILQKTECDSLLEKKGKRKTGKRAQKKEMPVALFISSNKKDVPSGSDLGNKDALSVVNLIVKEEQDHEITSDAGKDYL